MQVNNNKKGGYQILDLGGANLTTSKTTINGVYETLKGSYKAILVEGLIISGTDYKPQFVNIANSNGTFLVTFIASASATTITMIQLAVTNDDGVTATTIVFNKA